MTTLKRILLILFGLSIGVLPMLLCGCTIRVESDPPDTSGDLRKAIDEILEAETLKPVPDDRFTPPVPRPSAPDPEPLEPMLVIPAGWPEGVMVQKYTADPCPACVQWDRDERPQLEGVVMPDIIAWVGNQPRSREAVAAGVDVVPYFELRRGSETLWRGKGYWRASDIIAKARQFGGRN